MASAISVLQPLVPGEAGEIVGKVGHAGLRPGTAIPMVARTGPSWISTARRRV